MILDSQTLHNTLNPPNDLNLEILDPTFCITLRQVMTHQHTNFGHIQILDARL